MELIGPGRGVRCTGVVRVCGSQFFLAFLVENITECWVPNGLSETFPHYWAIESEL